jgi:hypothetical protein
MPSQRVDKSLLVSVVWPHFAAGHKVVSLLERNKACLNPISDKSWQSGFDYLPRSIQRCNGFRAQLRSPARGGTSRAIMSAMTDDMSRPVAVSSRMAPAHD